MNNFIENYINKENNRQANNIELIASENYPSQRILSTLSTSPHNKYAEGYPSQKSIDEFTKIYPDYVHTGKIGRYYGGCENVDMIELYGRYMWQKVFGTRYHCNLQPHSGSQANMAVYAAFLKPGDKILSMSLDAGGHLTHSAKVSFVSELYNVETYGVDEKGWLNYEEIQAKIIDFRPDLILFGASAYSRELDFGYLNDLIQVTLENCAEEDGSNGQEEYNPIIMVDMAHIAGLVATGYHSTPFGFADVITTTTHKTLRGPRGGLIFCKPEFAEIVDKAVFPYCQGGSLMNVIAAKAVCAEEALTPEYEEYIKNVTYNAWAMAEQFKLLGYKIISNGTDNHLFLLDLTGTGVTGRELQEACDKQGITLNKNAIPNDPLPPSEASGVRIGTAAMTTKGWKKEDFIKCAVIISKIIRQIKADKEAKIALDKALNTIEQQNKNQPQIDTKITRAEIYKDIEIWKNATVVVSENMLTHEMIVSWMKQPNSEEVDHYPIGIDEV